MDAEINPRFQRSSASYKFPPMKYRDLQIQTQREFPNNARTEGFGWLVRAGYLTRENELTQLGQHFVAHIRSLSSDSSFISHLSSFPTR